MAKTLKFEALKVEVLGENSWKFASSLLAVFRGNF